VNEALSLLLAKLTTALHQSGSRLSRLCSLTIKSGSKIIRGVVAYKLNQERM
jgi:hypothetical protein